MVVSDDVYESKTSSHCTATAYYSHNLHRSRTKLNDRVNNGIKYEFTWSFEPAEMLQFFRVETSLLAQSIDLGELMAFQVK
jgi:hypothetical protein